ncbi:MAG: amidase, partial [Actinomycetales bacterium]
DPIADDDAVHHLRRAGTIMLGKTNTPEFGLCCYTESSIMSSARTPWDVRLGAGGSSGGAAAAVAFGLASAAHGSDGGGSIRIPASCCGLVGIKPSRGRVSNGPWPDGLGELGVQGPIARTVQDAAALLDVLVGNVLAGDAIGTFLQATQQPVRRLRIGRSCAPVIADTTVHPDCLTAFEQTTALLTALGHEVIDLPVLAPREVVPAFEMVWSVGAAMVPVPTARENDLLPLTRWLRARGRSADGLALGRAVATLRTATRAVLQIWEQVDVVLTPTLASPPVAVGALRDDADPEAGFELQKHFTPFTAVVNMTGQPAITLPLCWNDASLPIGMQFIGAPSGEALLLSLAAELQQAQPWMHRRPTGW